MWRGLLLVAAISLVAMDPGQTGGNARRASAQQLLAEARTELRQRPAAERAESWAYLAHQESDGGLGATQDFLAAFGQAKALPASQYGLKAEVESDAVDALLEAGDEADAIRLGLAADAGRGFIQDRLVPEELSQGQIAAAWFLWSKATSPTAPSPFPYHAATALLALPPPNPAWLDSLKAQGLAATEQVADVAGGESGLEFLQALQAANPSDTSVTRAALHLWRALPRLAGTTWEIASLRGQLQTLIQKADKNAAADLSTKAPSPPHPHLEGGRPAAAPPRAGAPPVAAAAASAEPSGMGYFELYASASMARDHVMQPEMVASAFRRLTPAIAKADPAGLAELAVGCFELKRAADSQHLLAQALAAAAAMANATPTGPVDYSRSTALHIFGLAAEIDFLGTATQALSLRPSALKPAILARVARMAAASTTWKPGQQVAILN
ncbi:MAG TPA: hypothetical protein VMV31_07700 [Terriglobales bacterium]|nr:hypothetical protein [Terriglobales bacterium]